MINSFITRRIQVKVLKRLFLIEDNHNNISKPIDFSDPEKNENTADLFLKEQKKRKKKHSTASQPRKNYLDQKPTHLTIKY